MAEVTETNELHAIIILKYKLLIKFYTNETLMHRLAQKVMNKTWGFHGRGYRDQRITCYYYTEIQTVH